MATRTTGALGPRGAPAARAESRTLGPRGSAIALTVVGICLAILWPKIFAPQLPSRSGEPGCCDIFAENDVTAINVISEICTVILQKRDGKPLAILAPGKLTKETISTCRREVNSTCGIDIAAFLDHNVRLGKSYKHILDEVRTYNSSNCLKENYGVEPWSLGIPHSVGKFWVQDFGVRQERPPHLRSAPLHPALRERGRAITPTLPASSAPMGAYKASGPVVQRSPKEGRPMPIGGMRPPMGGAGGVIPPPKSSVGFLMPLYTLCIVIFFMYTVFKMIFRRQEEDPSNTYEAIKPDPDFRRKVFTEPNRNNRSTPESNKLGDDEMDVLRARLAETERVMERIVMQMRGPLARQDSSCPLTNGSVQHGQTNGSVQHEQTNGAVHPDLTKITDEYLSKRETTPPSFEDSTPVSEKPFTAPKERSISPAPVAEKVAVSDDKVDKNEMAKENEENKTIESDPQIEKEKEKATVKVVGMEMTASCEGFRKWSTRTPTPPIVQAPHPTAPITEISSIYLEGALPHQSRLLVSESETHTEEALDGDEKDAPIVLSGKMTLSLINDELKELLRDLETGIDFEDDEFTTASAMTMPKQEDTTVASGEEEEEEIEEEVEEEEEEEEDEIEELEFDDEPKAKK